MRSGAADLTATPPPQSGKSIGSGQSSATTRGRRLSYLQKRQSINIADVREMSWHYVTWGADVAGKVLRMQRVAGMYSVAVAHNRRMPWTFWLRRVVGARGWSGDGKGPRSQNLADCIVRGSRKDTAPDMPWSPRFHEL